MDSVRINRSDLVGISQSKTAVLEALIKANALNQTGNVDYNKYGKLDGIGLKSYLTSLWIIFYFVYLYQITTQRRKRRLEEIILLGVKIVRLENC